MKSLSIRAGVILIGFCIFGYSEVWGEDWKLYWNDPFAAYYYDADKVIRSSQNIVRVWQKIVYTKNGVAELVVRLGATFKATNFEINLSEFDCSEGQYKELQRSFFSQNATSLGEQTNSSLVSINQGTPQEKLHKMMCKSAGKDVGPTDSKSTEKEEKSSQSKPSKKRK